MFTRNLIPHYVLVPLNGKFINCGSVCKKRWLLQKGNIFGQSKFWILKTPMKPSPGKMSQTAVGTILLCCAYMWKTVLYATAFMMTQASYMIEVKVIQLNSLCGYSYF